MCYYTVTMDHNDGESHTRAIMILDSKDETEATAKFLNTFGAKYYNAIQITKDIHIPQGFDRLLTDQVKKYILKSKNKTDGAPLVSYQNMIRLNHE